MSSSTVLVTGATGGIGEHIARQFAEQGWTVLVGDPAEAAAGAVRLALLPDDGPTGQLFSWDGTVVPW
jgi:NAD(P)-dependent dehydrogenase (short-subunit alcohol dehydrogenase family)